MLRIPCETPELFERNLTRFIATEVGQWRRKITYLDCRHPISEYVFSREDMQSLRENVNVVRIHRAYDLLEWMYALPRNPPGAHAHYLVISPFYHLLEGFSLPLEKEWMRLWEAGIERVEQCLPIHVVEMEN